MIVLCVRAVTLPGAAEGIAFYLMPDFGRLFAERPEQWSTFGDAVYAAMGQAFFTLVAGHCGHGDLRISCIGRQRSLTGEAVARHCA